MAIRKIGDWQYRNSEDSSRRIRISKTRCVERSKKDRQKRIRRTMHGVIKDIVFVHLSPQILYL